MKAPTEFRIAGSLSSISGKSNATGALHGFRPAKNLMARYVVKLLCPMFLLLFAGKCNYETFTINEFTVSPNHLCAPGDVTITWNCSRGNPKINGEDVPLSGTRTERLTEGRIYTLELYNGTSLINTDRDTVDAITPGTRRELIFTGGCVGATPAYNPILLDPGDFSRNVRVRSVTVVLPSVISSVNVNHEGRSVSLSNGVTDAFNGTAVTGEWNARPVFLDPDICGRTRGGPGLPAFGLIAEIECY